MHLYEGEYCLYLYMKAHNAFFMPWSKQMPKTISELKEIARKERIPLAMKSIPSDFLCFFDDTEFDFERDRNLDEYIY